MCYYGIYYGEVLINMIQTFTFRRLFSRGKVVRLSCMGAKSEVNVKVFFCFKTKKKPHQLDIITTAGTLGCQHK